jgi:hypothetical protein
MLPRPSHNFNPYNYSQNEKEATTKLTKNTKYIARKSHFDCSAFFLM